MIAFGRLPRHLLVCLALAASPLVAAPTVSSVSISPGAPGQFDNVVVTAQVQPSAGTTISQVKVNYSTGAVTTATAFRETMATSPTTAGVAGTGTQNVWTATTVRNTTDVRQRSGTANHTAPVVLSNATTNGTTRVTCTSTSALWPAMTITGPNIAAGTTIATISTDGVTFTISQIATGSGTGLTLTAAGVTLTNCATSTTSTTVTCASTVGLVVGMGVNIPTNPGNPTVSQVLADGISFVLTATPTNNLTGQTYTASGTGAELNTGTATSTDTMFAMNTSIDASTASAGYLEFYARTSGLIANNGWFLQVSPDAGSTWSTPARLSETSTASQLAACTLNSANSGTGSTTILCANTTGLSTGISVQGVAVLIANCVTDSANNPTVVLTPNTANLAVGMYVTGTNGQGIPAAARIVAINPGVSFTMSAAATVTNASPGITLTANYLQGNTTITAITPNTSFTVSSAAFYSGVVSLVNHGFMLKHYDFAASELTNKLRVRFCFSGYTNVPPAATPTCDIDDIFVSLTSGNPPASLTMADGGLQGYSATIPALAGGTTVTYSVSATDNLGATTTTSNGSYTVATVSPALAVTPATSFTTGGPVGGPFAPASATYTLSNTGTGSLNWTAAKTAGWLSLSATTGIIPAGGTATLLASANAAALALAAGSYSDTITFTNTTNATGTTTRSVSLTAYTAPVAPALTASTAYGRGSTQKIAWAAVANATSYTIEVSDDANFSDVLGTQTVTSPSASFLNLIEGAIYYYRVVATNPAGSSVHSNVLALTPDATPPAVAITSPATGTTTAATSITVTGTSSDALSGVASVKVNNVAVTTSNGFATWTATVPLGFGTHAITATATDNAGNFTTTAPVTVNGTATPTYNPLYIPDTMTGTTFNLTLDPNTKRYFAGVATNTYSYNHAPFWGPTLFMKNGDFVRINLTNNLVDTTTTHWHGFHIPAIMDGGPHQTIPPGTVWSPSFYVRNKAAMFWFHPHLHTTTQQQVTMGAGGLIIVQDDEEAALPLPRTYGVDDFPLVLTSRTFVGQGATANQFATTGAFGDNLLVNGTLKPQVTLPSQVVRLRFLDAEIARNHNLGFSDNRTFYVIGTDGGLLNAPVPVTRMVMGSSERYEILVNLSDLAPGSTLDLMTYNSNQPAGYSGGQAATSGANGSLLNNIDFVDLHINIGAATANPINSIPATLVNNAFWTAADVTFARTVNLNGVGGVPLNFDNLVYSPSVINQRVNYNAVEQWTLANNSNLAHTFHIHDIQFYLTSMPGGIPAYMQGWKDSFIIPQGTSVSFIAKFDDFASNANPFMFHCHFLQHEDGGLMGQFLVQNNAVESLAIASFTRLDTDPTIHMQFKATPGTTYTVQYSPDVTTGSWVDVGSITSNGTSGDFYETDPTRLGQGRGFYRVTMPVISQ